MSSSQTVLIIAMSSGITLLVLTLSALMFESIEALLKRHEHQHSLSKLIWRSIAPLAALLPLCGVFWQWGWTAKVVPDILRLEGIGSLEPLFHPAVRSSLIILWAAGCCGLVIRKCSVRFQFRRWIIQHSSAISKPACADQIEQQLFGYPLKHLRYRVWHHSSSPALSGTLSPIILLPAHSLRENSSERDSLSLTLLHELQHLKHHDEWRARALDLISALYWMLPIWTLVRKRLALFREWRCDAAVAVRVASIRQYQAHLVQQTLLTDSDSQIVASPMLSGLPGLNSRLKRLDALDHRSPWRSCQQLSRLWRRITSMASMLLLLMTALWVGQVTSSQAHTMQWTTTELNQLRNIAIASLEGQPEHGSLHALFAIRALNASAHPKQGQ